MTTHLLDSRPCPECPTGIVYGRYTEVCSSCWARRFLGMTRLPLSHTPHVLDPEGRDTLAEDEGSDDAA